MGVRGKRRFRRCWEKGKKFDVGYADAGWARAGRKVRNAHNRATEFGARGNKERRVWGIKVRWVGLREARWRCVGRAGVGGERKG